MSMTTKEEEQQTSLLDMVTYTYDTEIANYSLDEYEDLLDEDEDSLYVGDRLLTLDSAVNGWVSDIVRK